MPSSILKIMRNLPGWGEWYVSPASIMTPPVSKRLCNILSAAHPSPLVWSSGRCGEKARVSVRLLDIINWLPFTTWDANQHDLWEHAPFFVIADASLVKRSSVSCRCWSSSDGQTSEETVKLSYPTMNRMRSPINVSISNGRRQPPEI